jgi:hypothetical protein
MAIYAVVGVPGSGKTYSMVYMGLRAVAEGKRVWSNFGVDREAMYRWLRLRCGMSRMEAEKALARWQYWSAPEELVGVRIGLLLFDEAHLWAFSRRWKELPVELVWWWTQSRKMGVDVYFSAQRWQSVDAALRDLCAEVWYAKGRLLWWFRLVRTDPHGADRRMRMGYVWVRWDPLAACVYDTMEVLVPPAWSGVSEAGKWAEAFRRQAERSALDGNNGVASAVKGEPEAAGRGRVAIATRSALDGASTRVAGRGA